MNNCHLRCILRQNISDCRVNNKDYCLFLSSTHSLISCIRFVYIYKHYYSLFLHTAMYLGSMPNELSQFNKSHLQNVSDKEIKSYEHFIWSFTTSVNCLFVHVFFCVYGKCHFSSSFIQIVKLFGSMNNEKMLTSKHRK